MVAVLGINAFHADSSAALIVDGKIIKKPDEEKWTWNECRQVKSRPWWGYNYPDPCKDLYRKLDDGRRKGYPPQSR